MLVYHELVIVMIFFYVMSVYFSYVIYLVICIMNI
jgi:hypothetical protein